MFKTISIILFLVCFMILSGCSTVLKNTSDLANIAVANDQVMSGQVAETIKSVNLSSTESLIVDHAINQYSGFVDKWKSSINYLDSSEPLFTEFVADYRKIVAQYRAVKEQVVKPHWSEYTETNRALLNEYHGRVDRIDQSVNGLIDAGNRHQALLDALYLGQVLAGIAGNLL
ncbi:MAG: hypothetical protein K2Q13_10130 [Nitrosomonas sp.]|uniref:hypothetical protein n=1 Tax=Nitrosomonas sp. TaxID=42353 RepID=UPI0025EA9FF9|nr:hypothetical protein [Nitrosomonas sp.]MBY0475399.1 hypothetical protein [Nitrosomonas sp.]